jgi:F0F1-type ATP synthase membrane subunit b/b'
MGLKEDIAKALDNVKDAVSEAGHRSAAEEEQAKRDIAGEAMTPGEHVASVANQAKHTVQADIDETKRDLRNES